jgi:hypothetical protein
MDTVIQPSIFGIAPRNEFTKVVGEFIMHNSRELENVEIEIKLGKLHAAADGQPLHRIRMPTQNETSECLSLVSICNADPKSCRQTTPWDRSCPP